METQSKFLDKQYLETRLGEFKEIKRKEIVCEVYESNRVLSNSMYISFYVRGSNGGNFKQQTLRISDHPLKDNNHPQFIIDPRAIMTKKKKKQFVSMIESCIKKANTKQFYKELNKIGEN